jgi:hypothetical protein
MLTCSLARGLMRCARAQIFIIVVEYFWSRVLFYCVQLATEVCHR